MSITAEAQWVVERNLSDALTLAGIAETCGVSRFHLAHTFNAAFQCPLMYYVRARRLADAAEALVAGTPDILQLALSSGYSSHEAFSRTFKTAFGVTPDQARRGQPLRHAAMTRPPKPPAANVKALQKPRFEKLGPMLLVGLSRSQELTDTQAIASQWQHFMVLHNEIPHKAASAPLGITLNMDEDGRFDYACAAEVSTFARTPKTLIELQIPEQTYVVFTHRGHVSALRATYAAIWDVWFPSQSRRPAEAPRLERHLPNFDPRTGMGGVEVLIPVTP